MSKPIVILYATREGQTRRIAEHVADVLKARGFDVDLKNVRDGSTDLKQYSAAILAASAHGGKHEPEMVKFVQDRLAELEQLPSSFLSVTLSEAGAEMLHLSP